MIQFKMRVQPDKPVKVKLPDPKNAKRTIEKELLEKQPDRLQFTERLGDSSLSAYVDQLPKEKQDALEALFDDLRALAE